MDRAFWENNFYHCLFVNIKIFGTIIFVGSLHNFANQLAKTENYVSRSRTQNVDFEWTLIYKYVTLGLTICRISL